MLVYLAGPVDVGAARKRRWIGERMCQQYLNRAGISTFSPAHAFSVVYFGGKWPVKQDHGSNSYRD